MAEVMCVMMTDDFMMYSFNYAIAGNEVGSTLFSFWFLFTLDNRASNNRSILLSPFILIIVLNFILKAL